VSILIKDFSEVVASTSYTNTQWILSLSAFRTEIETTVGLSLTSSTMNKQKAHAWKAHVYTFPQRRIQASHLNHSKLRYTIIENILILTNNSVRLLVAIYNEDLWARCCITLFCKSMMLCPKANKIGIHSRFNHKEIFVAFINITNWHRHCNESFISCHKDELHNINYQPAHLKIFFIQLCSRK